MENFRILAGRKRCGSDQGDWAEFEIRAGTARGPARPPIQQTSLAVRTHPPPRLSPDSMRHGRSRSYLARRMRVLIAVVTKLAVRQRMYQSSFATEDRTPNTRSAARP